ncbi:MAG: HTH-type transcriptional regulator, bacterioopsin transcriptional activator, partial [Blastocatellia bacterium]|nr:HTH-type transcriptional regulator, bacterioopsin transcriptional activator [Blastocatellia bacterium]
MFKNKVDNAVLVINDIPDQVEVMKLLLEKSGYQVRTAYDGQEGLNDAGQFPPALIISDVAMPNMDGIELTSAVRADPELFNIPVLLVSANRKDSDSVVRGLQAGADDYLEAPYDPLMLVVKAARLIVQKRAEEKIRESEAQYRSLAETATDVIVTVDLEGTIVLINSSVERTFGYRVDEVLGNSVISIMPEFLRQAEAISLVRKNLSDKEKLNWEPLEFSGIHKDGHEIPLEVSFGQFKQNLGYFYTGIARDITNRKNIEVALSESRSRLASIIESAMDAMITVDSNQSITIFNKAAELMFNCSASEAIGRSLGRFITGPYPDRFGAGGAALNINEITAKHIKGTQSLSGRRSGGEEFPIEASISQVDASNEKLCTVILRDVTERKEAEEKLARSEERLRLAQQAGDIGVFDWDMRTGEVTWTEEMEALVGLSTGEFRGTFEDWRRYIHPDDLEQVDNCIQVASETGNRDWHQEYRLVRADTGEIRWMEVFGHIFLGAGDSAQRMVGVNTDITERKSGEEKLKSSEARLAEAQRVSHLGSWEWEIETQSGIWSDEMFRIIELEPDSEPLSPALVQQYLLQGKSEKLENLLRTESEEEVVFVFEHAVTGAKGTPK